MKDAYTEDTGDEFPINSQVRCGQTRYAAEFGGVTPVEQAPVRARQPASTVLVKPPYFPKATPRLKKLA